MESCSCSFILPIGFHVPIHWMSGGAGGGGECGVGCVPFMWNYFNLNFSFCAHFKHVLAINKNDANHLYMHMRHTKEKADLKKKKRETQYDSIETISNLFTGSRDYPCHAENIHSKNQSRRNQLAIIRPATTPFIKGGRDETHKSVQKERKWERESCCTRISLWISEWEPMLRRWMWFDERCGNADQDIVYPYRHAEYICDLYTSIHLLSHAKSKQMFGDKSMRASVFCMCV